MNEFKVKQGLDINLPSTKDENTLYHTTDTKRTFIGSSEFQKTILENYTISEESGEDLIVTSADTVEQAFGKVEAAILNNEFTIVETFKEVQTSCGLDEHFKYIPPVSDEILSGSTSLENADLLLSANLKVLSGKVESIVTSGDSGNKQDKIISGYTPSTARGEDLIVTSADTVEQAFGKIETSIENNERTTVSALESLRDSCGLDEELLFNPPSSSKYISASTNITEALDDLSINIEKDFVTKESYNELKTAYEELKLVVENLNSTIKDLQTVVEDDEYTTANALNDLSKRVEALEEK